jgi:hypothetical protein
MFNKNKTGLITYKMRVMEKKFLEQFIQLFMINVVSLSSLWKSKTQININQARSLHQSSPKSLSLIVYKSYKN